MLDFLDPILYVDMTRISGNSIVTITITFLSAQGAFEDYKKWNTTPHSEYTKRMALSIQPPETVPSEAQYLTFVQSTMLDFSEKERKFIESQFEKINIILKKNALSLGSLQLNLALGTGEGNLFYWSIDGNTLRMNRNAKVGISLSECVSMNIANCSYIDITRHKFTNQMYKFIFFNWLNHNPQPSNELFTLLGYEKVQLQFPESFSARLTTVQSVFYKKEVVLKKDKTPVSVVALKYFNDNCQFNGVITSKEETEDSLTVDCVSGGFVVITQVQGDTYTPVMKNGNVWLIKGDDILSPQGSKPQKSFYWASPSNVLAKKFINYIENPKNTDHPFTAFFNKHFKSTKLEQTATKSVGLFSKEPPIKKEASEKTPLLGPF